MKILYLKLKNYATIYTAMGLKELEIDFSKSKNNVILFVGNNGSGKTSILSTLHPFPYYGSMDIRSNNNIIREDKDGFKEIHIQHESDIYKIQHHYKNTKRGIILKSFIQKNDEELNPNGNVTSFNEIVKDELSLELDFLRILRLGSNVTNLIDMKASERKSFTSFLLSDIGTYTDLFKKVSEDNRILKSMIKTVSDKLVRLNVLDRSELESNIKNIEDRLLLLNNKRNNLQYNLGDYEGKVKALLPEGIDYTLSNVNELINRSKDLINTKNKIFKSINKLCIVLTQDIDTEISLVNKEVSDYENQYTINENMVLFYNEQLSPLYNKQEELNSQLRLCVSDITYRQIHNLYIELSNKVNEYKEKFKEFVPIYTKENLVNLFDILHQINNIAKETYGFDMKAVKQTIELLRESVNIDSYIARRKKEINDDILKITTELKISLNPKSPVILFKPQNCPEAKCPYLYLYDVLFNENNNSDNKNLLSLETEKELLENISYVNKNIDYIFMILKSNINLINKGNIPYFSIDIILDSLYKGQPILFEDYMTDLISEAEEYEDYLETKSKLKELKIELDMLKYNESTLENIKAKILQNNMMISDILNKKSKSENDNEILKEKILYLKTNLESLNMYKSYLEDISKIEIEIKDINTEITLKNKLLEDSKEYSIKVKEIKSDIDHIDWEYKKYNDELFKLKVKLKEFISLSEENDILNKKFDDISIVRESLSSNKGIPLLYMQLYLKNIKMFVNELLRIVYADNFEIDDFDINENEFNIPYIKNNIKISDVAYASQGEKSFLSLALSFALINQSIEKYNILLLDEIDSTLDIKNRALFLNILEKQMESISAEQIFLITHNNMFENYPVDIILTSSNKINNYNNANIIFSV